MRETPSGGQVSMLSDHTTIRLGGPAMVVRADSAAVLIECVIQADADHTPVLVLGGGSNVVVADAGFGGVVAAVAHTGISFDRTAEHVVVHVEAGESWDDVVVASLAQGLAGIECLSGIPGLAGATPIQNVGAYGAEISQVVTAVRAFDRAQGAEVILSAADCGFGYRTSALKGGHHVVLGVDLALTESAMSAPIRYQQLADALGVQLHEAAPARDVRAAVLGLRAAKGMLIDAADPDSVSVGSFFTNPVLAVAPEGAPHWPTADGRVKISAAWLIEQAGFARGYGDGRVGLSRKHTLALVNRGGATTAELITFAAQIRDGVRAHFGVELDVEPALIGVEL